MSVLRIDQHFPSLENIQYNIYILIFKPQKINNGLVYCVKLNVDYTKCIITTQSHLEIRLLNGLRVADMQTIICQL